MEAIGASGQQREVHEILPPPACSKNEPPQAEIQQENEPKGKMRIRLSTNYGKEGKVSIAYKEIDAHRKSPIAKFIMGFFYKPVTVLVGGREQKVLMNIGSLSKRLNIDRRHISNADQSAMRVFIQHHAFIASMAKNGIKAPAAQKVAITIEEQLQGKVSGEQVKAQGDKKHTIHYMDSSGVGTAYVSLSEKVLGQGGFGRVTKAISFTTGAIVAHKAAKDEQRQAMLANEGKLHLKFEGCTNILQAHSVGNGGVILEFMNGGDLTNLNDVADAQELQQILYQALQGLAQMHEKGFVHRDVKPANFLLHRDGEKITVKLADLGVIGQKDSADEGAGTPTYLSPNRLASAIGLESRQNSPKDDLFAFGVSLCEMLYGGKPKFSRTIKDLYEEGKKSPATLTTEQKQERLQKIRESVKDSYKDIPKAGSVDRLIYDLLQGNLTSASEAAKSVLELDLPELEEGLNSIPLKP